MFGAVQTVHAAHTRLVVPEQAVVSYCAAEQTVHAAHSRLVLAAQAVVSYSVAEQVVHAEHPEVTAPLELQTLALEPARARVHRMVGV